MSDGRSPETTGPGLIHRLQQQAVSVFTVPLGAQTPMLDLGLAEIEAPEKALINDAVPVTVWLDHFPDTTKIDASRDCACGSWTHADRPRARRTPPRR